MSLKKTKKKKKNLLKVPKTVQESIPVQRIYDDGLFKVGKNQYSRSYRFTDVNYAVCSKQDKMGMLHNYMELLNSLDTNATTKITINNRHLNRNDFKRDILLAEKEDGLNDYRKEYNQMLLSKASGGDTIVQEKYFTMTIDAESPEEAELAFDRVGNNLSKHLAKFGAKCETLDAVERLRILHDFYRSGEEVYFNLDLSECRKRGYNFKDYICPDSIEVKKNYLVLGDRFARVLFLKDYAAAIDDDFVTRLTDKNKNMMLTIDINPMSMAQAIRETNRRLLGAETNITKWQRRQNENNNFSAEVPYDLEQSRRELRETLNDIKTRDQRLNNCLLTIVHTAESLEELDRDTKAILATGLEGMNQLSVLNFQQLEGMATALPVGVKQISATRTLTTENLTAFIPFRVQEIQHEHGIYYGQNVESKNMIIADRRKLLNGNSFILGVSGSGKSFAAKSEIVNYALSTDADILVIDPEREYAPLVRALGGEVVEISAVSGAHINALDINKEYGEVNPIIEKSQFLQSLCEQIIAGNHFLKGQQSIIDRCTENVYRYYLQGNYQGVPPTLQDFREELLKQPEPEAKALALELELFTTGTLNTFAKQTNVNTNNRLICYDILELGEQLRAVGMLVILDSILNRITKNRAEGKQTFVYIDEVYLLFMHEYSAQFLFKLWKRVRKYGAYCTGITQDVEDLLQSHTARAMLSNSEFVMMMNQATINKTELAHLLNISSNQLKFITNVDAGKGLMKVGSTLVPFENHFPKDTQLYKLMTTKQESQE